MRAQHLLFKYQYHEFTPPSWQVRLRKPQCPLTSDTEGETFNATMKTEFDETVGNINAIPQDIGRVILNLITNAFYAFNARLNESFGQEKAKQNSSGYKPIVSVRTKKEGNNVLVSTGLKVSRQFQICKILQKWNVSGRTNPELNSGFVRNFEYLYSRSMVS